MISVGGNDQIIPLFILGEIFLRVINNVVCTKRAHQVHILCTAHASHFSSQRFGNLHGKHPHATGRPIDQHLLPELYLSFRAQTLQGGDSCRRHGRCLLEREIGRFQRQCIFASTGILSKTAKTTPGYVTEYLITWLKLRDVSANCFNAPRYISTEYDVFGFENATHEANQERYASQEMPVTCICGCCVHLYQDFIVLGSRFCYLFELKNIR